ncbi:MAG TPA: ferredoxin reductase [Polyangiaceae bacterium]|nr:ferredoxin reductase [Polyangiaceae bacterium]
MLDMLDTLNPVSWGARLASALVYPRTLDDFVGLVAPLRSRRAHHAEVVFVRRETYDTVTLVLRPGPHFPRHRAGQHTALTLEIDGVRRTRIFSIASAEPREHAGRRTIELTVRARPSGLVTPRLTERDAPALREGDLVELGAPAGDFVLGTPVHDRLLLVSGGSGITPVMAMLRTLVERRHRGEVVFLTWAKSPRDALFRAELDAIAAAAPLTCPGLRVAIAYGPMSEGALSAQVPDLASWEVFACGPPGMLEVVRAELAARGDLTKLHTEAFSAPAIPPVHEGDPAREGGTVTFARAGKTAEGRGPILPMAEGAGLRPRHGCRIGICHTCLCRKVSGTTRDSATGALSTDGDVDIRICTSEPVGPVVVDL